MRHSFLLLFCLALPAAAHAQGAVERVPLSPIIGTDDMTGGAAPQDNTDVLTATPPPGPDSLPPQTEIPADSAPSGAPEAGNAPMPKASDSYPKPYERPADVAPPPGPAFRNGKTPADEDLSRQVSCMLNLTFDKNADGAMVDNIKAYLDESAPKVNYKPLKRGARGEYRYCLNVLNHADRADIYKNLKRRLPAKTGRPSGVALSGESFTLVTTSN